MKKLLFILAIAMISFAGCKKKDTAVKGCMDPSASNYNASATESDGNCKYNGCTDPAAFNYSSTANVNDGSCETAPKKLLIMNFTATWCPPCGSYGELGFENANKNLAAKVVGIACHFSNSDPLYSSAAADLKSAIITGTSVPSFSEGDSMIVAGAYTDVNYLTNVYTPYADAILVKPFLVNTFITKTISGGKVKVTAKTKFFGNTTGDYYLSVYILEDKIIAAQETNTGTVSNYEHNKVLRASMTATFGENLVNGAVTSGTFYDKSYEWPISSSWNSSNLSVVAIIWEKVGSKYKYVNAYKR